MFGAWIEATGKTGATRLDSKRRRLIKAALADYPPDDVIDAVRGWRQSPHHRGENERRTVFNDLGLLLRDSEHIEKFRDLARNAPAVKPATPEPAQWDAIRSATGEFG